MNLEQGLRRPRHGLALAAIYHHRNGILAGRYMPNFLDLQAIRCYHHLHGDERKRGAMKIRLSGLPAAVLVLLIFLISSVCFATVVTFDDLSVPLSAPLLTNRYQSLDWTNFA